jgi:tetraacyldisaccharide 4'-kinase
VPFREPSWWYDPQPGFAARALTPAAWVYGRLAARRMAQGPRHTADLPVICIGNFTAGGTGKTPLALWIAGQLAAQNLSPVFLTRGYGSAVRAPTLVDPERHGAADVGDEALLLARAGRVMVSPDRVAGVKAFASCGIGGDVLLMDDGLQNPGLAKDLTIAVVDGARGFGNGCVIPSGPLRAPLAAQLAKTDTVVVNGRRDDRDRVAAQIARWFSGPVLSAGPEPAGDTSWLRGQRVLPFAGIGNPERFFRLLERLGATLVGERRFADHHAFTDAEAAQLMTEADKLGAMLVTTEKDFVRLRRTGAQSDLRCAARALPIALSLRGDDGAVVMARIAGAITQRMS